jgi:serine/threonine protein kinase
VAKQIEDDERLIEILQQSVHEEPLEVPQPIPVIAKAAGSSWGDVSRIVREEKAWLPSDLPAYEFVKLIGIGAFGEVWLVKQRLTGVFYAVKMLDKSMVGEEELTTVRRYKELATNDLHMVPVEHVGETSGSYYLVLALADDARGARLGAPDDYQPVTLSGEVERRGALPVQEVIAIGRQLCGAIGRVHRAGLVHRDIKSPNIMRAFGTWRIADVGLVPSKGVKDPLRRTHEYAPHVGVTNPAGDLYCLGKVLYQLISGWEPELYPLTPEPPDHAHDRSCFRRLMAVIERACSDNVNRWYQSASEMQLALDETPAVSSGGIGGLLDRILGRTTTKAPIDSSALPPRDWPSSDGMIPVNVQNRSSIRTKPEKNQPSEESAPTIVLDSGDMVLSEANSNPTRTPPPPKPITENPNVPDYEPIKRIGKGGFGEIWLVREKVSNMFRALKTLDKKVVRPVEMDGVRQYKQLAANHEHLVRIGHVGETDEFYYYALELADDASESDPFDPVAYIPATLDRQIRQGGAMGIDEAIAISLDVLAGLHRMHQSGLLHRDIKPSNVLRIKGKWRIVDLGLVLQHERRAPEAGTPIYSPPESVLAKNGDTFSTGRLFYELITGWSAAKFPRLPDQLLGASADPRVSRIIEVMTRACQEIPTLRYQTAREMAEALRDARQTGRNSRTWTILLIVAAALATLITALSIIFR